MEAIVIQNEVVDPEVFETDKSQGKSDSSTKQISMV
jgi:hypothetical protein